MARQPNRPHESRLYDRFSRLYEPIFTRVFGPRIHSTVRSLNIPAGAKVLEVGVGTGLSLEAYPDHAEVTAIDLSPTMLGQAREKVDLHGWRHISLEEMDALNMQLPNESFDYVTAFHVVSVVPDPNRLISEIIRVCKPGGTIAIINHVRSERPWIAPVVDLLDPLARRLGWQTKLSLSDLVENAPLRVERQFKTSPSSLFTVLLATKSNC